MKLAQGTAEEPLHRRRIEAVLRQCPELDAIGLHEAAVNSAEFSPDGQRLVSSSADRTVRIWDAATGEALGPPLPHTDRVSFANFAPRGNTIVSVENMTRIVRRWSCPTNSAPAAQLVSTAEVVSGATIDPAIGLMRLTPAQLHAVWRSLRAQPSGRTKSVQ